MTYNPSFIETKPTDEIQCQGCGGVVNQARYELPPEWVDDSGSWYCADCADWLPFLNKDEADDHPELTNYGPDDIGLRAPCDSYFSG